MTTGTSASTAGTAHLQAWPTEDTERVERCPVCGSDRRKPLHQGLRDRIFFCAPGEWSLVQCSDCTAAYLDPRPDRASIGRAYASYYTHQATVMEGAAVSPAASGLKQALHNGYLNAKYGYRLTPASALGPLAVPLFPLRQIAADLEVRCLPCPPGGGKVLDVGCGDAAWLKLMQSYGWQGFGQDFDPKAVETARSHGIDIRGGALEEASFQEQSFDAITLSHVIEHLHAPVETLRYCFRLMKPGGTLWIATPNIGSDDHEKYQSDWRGLEPPRHLVIFTPQALRHACIEAGFEAPELKGVPNAQFMHIQNTAIKQNRDPYAPVDLPPEKWQEFRREDLSSVRQPERSAIIMMTARRARKS